MEFDRQKKLDRELQVQDCGARLCRDQCLTGPLYMEYSQALGTGSLELDGNLHGIPCCYRSNCYNHIFIQSQLPRWILQQNRKTIGLLCSEHIDQNAAGTDKLFVPAVLLYDILSILHGI